MANRNEILVPGSTTASNVAIITTVNINNVLSRR